ETLLPAAARLSRVISSPSLQLDCLLPLFDNQALQRRPALYSVAWRSSNTPSHINRHLGPSGSASTTRFGGGRVPCACQLFRFFLRYCSAKCTRHRRWSIEISFGLRTG